MYLVILFDWAEMALPFATICFWFSMEELKPQTPNFLFFTQLADPIPEMNAPMLNTVGEHDECHFEPDLPPCPKFPPNAEIRMLN